MPASAKRASAFSLSYAYASISSFAFQGGGVRERTDRGDPADAFKRCVDDLLPVYCVTERLTNADVIERCFVFVDVHKIRAQHRFGFDIGVRSVAYRIILAWENIADNVGIARFDEERA